MALRTSISEGNHALAYANEKRQRNPLMMTAAELRAKEVAS
jgi:hypothetical protein